MLSEVLRRPGPTHSVFDVVAAACLLSPRLREVAILGFGGGGIAAALRAAGCRARIHGVDLDPAGIGLLRHERCTWIEPLVWHQGDAVEWLKGARPASFDAIVDDLSVPTPDDVVKPASTWNQLPELMANRLRPDGLAIFNLLRPAAGNWKSVTDRVIRPFGAACGVILRDFENRLVIAAADLPPSPTIGRRTREVLGRIRSRQASRVAFGYVRHPNPPGRRTDANPDPS